VLSAKTIASHFVHPAPALISRVCVVSLHVRNRIDVHAVVLHITEFRVIFRWAIFELPLIRGDVVPGDGYVERAMY
jgi:hypothetical protein